ncbi:zinc transporter ZIP10-like [Pecten maximus]|uniref:zinc transporter ZIP10-like n=1 Tax=Pecten maximus TaxID=6579 RepID=UPI001458B8A1|nr:zinc transporter ZIP10-like [Pecten maximus]
MCFTIRSSLCVICLTLHTLSCLITMGHATDGQDFASQPTDSSDTNQYLMPTNTLPMEHDDHEETPEEILKARNFYIRDLLERFGSNNVLSYDEIIYMLESLGLSINVLPKHVHSGHSHHPNDSHAGHSHDADHSEHIHDSDHKKHHPDTDHADHHHDHDHTNHGDHSEEKHHPDTDHADHDHDHDHTNHGDHSEENHDDDHDHHHAHSNNTNEDIHKHSDDSDHDDVRKRRSNDLVMGQRTKRSEVVHNHLGVTVESKTDDGKCGSLFSQFHIHKDETVNAEKLIQMCPGILSTLSWAQCRENKAHHDDNPVEQASAISFREIPAEVWGYSTIAIIIISMVGLLGVAVVPIMQKVFYNHLLLFLVALAIGALSGDAMLHLLPHALQGGDDHDHSSHGNSKADDKHTTAILKGLCGMSAIFLFFIMERVLSIITNLKRKHKKNGSVFVKESGEQVDDNTNIPLTECGAMRVTDSDCKEQIMGIHPGQKALTNFAESSHKECSREHEDHSDKDRQFDMVDQENPSSVLSHSHHHHGHSHILPTSVASIAWMVILGDGIHNFCDGLAIGAAFSSSITGGFSTSVAVFCHELPHEIGDFAVLLRAGMTVKQAVMYNCVSSILAFIGMLIGVAIGNFGDSISWVFVSVAGMFLYIALVDMLPELTAVDTRQGEHPFTHLLIQVGGMIIGATIMLLIALYETKLMNILEPV